LDEEIRKCPCTDQKTCEAYNTLYPIDPLCVYHYKEEKIENKYKITKIYKYISEERIQELAKRPIALLEPNFIEKLRKGICTTCQTKIEGFNNEISLKEYRISGMCQSCQDSVFGG